MALLLRMQPKNLILVGDHKQLPPTSMIPPQVCISKMIDDCGLKKHRIKIWMCKSLSLSFFRSFSRSLSFSRVRALSLLRVPSLIAMSFIIVVFVHDLKLFKISVCRSCKAPAMIDRYSSVALQLLALFTVLQNSIACPKVTAKSSRHVFTADCCAHLLRLPKNVLVLRNIRMFLSPYCYLFSMRSGITHGSQSSRIAWRTNCLPLPPPHKALFSVSLFLSILMGAHGGTNIL